MEDCFINFATLTQYVKELTYVESGETSNIELFLFMDLTELLALSVLTNPVVS